MAAHAEYLIVGGGYAGTTAAITLRRSGAKERVLIVSEEPEYPYYRYMLSKEFLQGKRQKERLFLRPPGFYEQQAIEVRLSSKAVALNVAERTVTLESGEELSFGRLLLATGASLRRLPVPGSELKGVCYLRTLSDAEEIQRRTAPGRRVVVVGGGFVGMELAASLTQKGVLVTVVDVVKTLWAHLFGQEMGEYFHQELHRQGVEILAPAHVQRIEGDARAERVVTQEGHSLPCDFVVIGVGVRAETTLAEQAGLKVDNGVVVDEFLESSEKGIYAAGDNARYWSRLYEAPLRIEHWDVAGQHGATAALNMLGRGQAFDEVPHFFSAVFNLSLEYLGYAPQWDRLTVRRHAPEKFTAFYSQGSVLKGALLVNNSQEIKACRELIKRKAGLSDLSALENTSSDLMSLAGLVS